MRYLYSVLLTVLAALTAQGAVVQVNVLSFGADPNGVRDSSDAFVKCFAMGRPLGTLGASYYIPAGHYKIASSTKIALPPWGIVYGDGPRLVAGQGTFIEFTSLTGGFTHIMAASEFDHFQIRDIAVMGPLGGVGTGLIFEDSHEFEIKNCRFYRWGVGVSMEYCWDFVANNLQTDNCSIAGMKLIRLVTDGTFLNPQFSNNPGYGLWVDTAQPQNIQMIRCIGGSMQYNGLGNWWNGGIDCFIDNVHLEGSWGADWQFGSATNRCENFVTRANHYDWSDAQYTNALALFPGKPFSYYQVVLSNAWHFRMDDGHRNVAGTPTMKKAAIYVSPLCADISIDSTSSYLAPRVVSAIPLNRTNPNRNLMPNGLFTRDERNPNNYPYTVISDYPFADFSFTSQMVSNIFGYTYSGLMTNSSSLYITNDFALKTNTIYTYSQVIKGPAGSVAMQRLVDKRQWNGGSNDVYQTINLITNTGDYQWVVSTYNSLDEFHTNPYLYTTAYSPGKTLIEIGEACLVEGNGVGRPILGDAFTGTSSTPWPTYASQIPNQGTWPKGKVIWNDGSIETNVLGWMNIAGTTLGEMSTPGTWVGFGGVNVVAGTPGYFPVWGATGPTLSTTSSVIQDDAGNVIIGTNALQILDVYSQIRARGSAADRPRISLNHPGWGDWTMRMESDGSFGLWNSSETSQILSINQAGTANYVGNWNHSGDMSVSGTFTASLIDLALLEADNITATNGVIFIEGTTAPTAASLGAGRGKLWPSNSVPPTLYWTSTTDGITATTYKVAGPP